MNTAVPERLAARWSILAACLAVGFWKTWVRVAQEALDGSLIVYLVGLVILAVVAGQGLARRRAGELPIHDRQADGIVGGMGVVFALAVVWLLVPRYPDHYQLLHLDVVAAEVFVLSGAVLLFGLRPVLVFWPVWLFLLVFTPLPFRTLATVLGGRAPDTAAALVVAAAVATAIAVGRTRGRAALGAAATLVVGFGVLAAQVAFFPGMPAVVVLLLPALAAGTVVPTAFFLARRWGGPMYLLGRQMEPLTAAQARKTALCAAAAAVVVAVLPLPPPTAQPIADAPPLVLVGVPLVVPPGWLQTDLSSHAGVARFLGKDAELLCQRLVAQQANRAWDPLDRPRIVSVDTITVAGADSLSVYPEGSLYQRPGLRRSAPMAVELGRGVTGRLYTVVDEQLLLTWTVLTFTWANSAATQRVNVISVDNHEPDAPFPAPVASRRAFLDYLLGTFLRGSRVAVDDNPAYKDWGMLLALGGALVEAQWAAAPAGGAR